MYNLGYTDKSQLEGFNIVDWDPLAPSRELTSVIKELMKTPETFFSKHKLKDGSVVDVEVTAKGITIDGNKYLYASQRKVDQRNMVQENLSHKLLKSEKTKYKTILELASDGVFIMDLEGKLVEYSRKACELLGYSDKEMQSLSVYDWDKNITKEEYFQLVNALKLGPIEVERFHTKKDGSNYIAYITANLININNETLIYASVRNITEQKENQQTIVEQNEQLEAIFQTALGGISLLNTKGEYEFVNNKYCEILEYSNDELISKSTFDFVDNSCMNDYKNAFLEALQVGVYEDFERICITKTGKLRRLRSSIALMPNKEQFLMTTVDNTKLFDAMHIIKKQTYIDDLTKLYNKKAYNEKIKENLVLYNRYKTTFSMMVFDIDFFKKINDNYGHIVGDKVLAELGRLIIANIRESDDAFRVGGEEFVVILRNTAIKEAMIVAQKLREVIEKGLRVIKDKVITLSIGVTEVIPGDDVDSIYKRADQYLYQAKNKGRNIVIGS
jgi:diguanylate cyclase (GGDEF)-like protein/PAS domain S-box-containing protein